MQLGLSTAAFYGICETEEAAERIARLGFDCAEVFLQTYSEYELPFVAQVKKNLGSVPCTSVHAMGIQFESQLLSRSRRQRMDAFDMLRRALDAAHALGAQWYVYHGRTTGQLSPLPWNAQQNVELLIQMEEMAVERGVHIAWENVFYAPLTTPERVREVRAMLPNQYYTLDIKQAMRAGCEMAEFVDAMGDRLANVHVCDWDAEKKLCLPGEGMADFDALFASLDRVGYDGSVIMEPYANLIPDEDALQRSALWLAEKMAKKAPYLTGEI